MTPEGISKVLQAILRIQAGDMQAREDFLFEYKPFVAKTAMNLCKRPLDWGERDELSIALIAFNSAIDSYDPGKRVPFLPYARVVIQNRLKDHFRKESRIQVEIPLETQTDEGKTVSPAEIQAAWENYNDRTIEDERQDELVEFEKLLGNFGINFESLVEVSPKHMDSRQTLFQVAKRVAEKKELIDYVLSKKQLPINELILSTGVNRKTLERGRKFIIATVLVIHHAMEFPYVRSYINLGAN
ncbi:MAG: RNA polymerase sigma-I factor [Firmicutes bacterium]|nr:RNA polymerase sigma-I factor [Bacillota bacterium]